MVARLKDKGLVEIATLRRRTLNLAGLKRISQADADYIVARLNEIDARIASMREKSPRGNERPFVW